MVNIKGIKKTDLLIALHKNSKDVGLSSHSSDYVEEMSSDCAHKYIVENYGRKFDYVMGKYMKVYIYTEELDTEQYNKVNGHNAAEDIVEKLREEISYESSSGYKISAK